MKRGLDIITVGSATIDVFVSVAQRQEEVLPHEKHMDVCYHIGGKSLITNLVMNTGGGGTNTAVAFSRLGLRTGWLGVLGNDEHGDIVEKQLKKEKIAILGKRKPGMTGYSVIIVGLQKDHVVLAYKGVNNKLQAKELPWARLRPRWFYFSSMVGDSLTALKRIAEYAVEHDIPYAFNPSMYLVNNGPEPISPILNGCAVLILNKAEAQSLLGIFREDNFLLKGLRKLTKGIVVITDGSKGAYAYDGEYKYTLVPRNTPVVETTGAGDSFASGFVAALMMKKDIAYALRLGQAEASSVISHIGAKEKLLKRREALDAARRSALRVVKEKI